MQVWWCVAVILMLRRWSHEDYEFVTTLGYILSSSHNEIQSKKKKIILVSQCLWTCKLRMHFVLLTCYHCLHSYRYIVKI